MKILVTGAAGFIGFHTCKALLAKGYSVVGIDNINDYYSVDLKLSRLFELGIQKDKAVEFDKLVRSSMEEHFSFYRVNIENYDFLKNLFENHRFDLVCHLAAQAGVRYSINNPRVYVNSNIIGFFNILECCKSFGVGHLLYASSSSVYGDTLKIPFETTDNTDKPISIYAATKKSNELMAYTYSHLYQLKTTGLRFFTVYGPWGRPDMALFSFTKAILNNIPIKIFNHGEMERDFTYIDDIQKGILAIVEKENRESPKNYSLYNIGNSQPVNLLGFVNVLEEELKTKAIKQFIPMQIGDVKKTWADVTSLETDFGYTPKTPIKKGVAEFVSWYKKYYYPA